LIRAKRPQLADISPCIPSDDLLTSLLAAEVRSAAEAAAFAVSSVVGPHAFVAIAGSVVDASVLTVESALLHCAVAPTVDDPSPGAAEASGVLDLALRSTSLVVFDISDRALHCPSWPPPDAASAAGLLRGWHSTDQMRCFQAGCSPVEMAPRCFSHGWPVNGKGRQPLWRAPLRDL